MPPTPATGPAPRRPRVTVYLEPRDIWVGVYVAPAAVYVCPVPLVVIRIARGPR